MRRSFFLVLVACELLTLTLVNAAGEPELTTRPHDVEVSFGGTAYFHCRADGDPAPQIIWYRNR